MKNFIKTVFASAIGVLISISFIIFVLFFSIITAAVGSLSSKEGVFIPKENSVLKLNLNNQVVDYIKSDPFAEFSKLINETQGPISLRDILYSIDMAAENDDIKGIYLTTDGYSGSYAISSEIRRKLESFKKTGKFVISYNNMYTQNQYYLSSVADSVYINPYGTVAVSGLSQQSIFFKNTLDKLGVEMQIFKVGTFKSAVEPFILNKMSEANKEQVLAYMGSTWDNVSEAIARSRGLSVEQVNNIANEGNFLKSANEIANTHLFDRTIYPTDIEPLVKQLANTKDDVNLISINDASKIASKKKDTSDKIAILYASGDITYEKSDGIYWKDFIKDIEAIKEDDDIKAVVLRINSPGGSAFATEIMWKAIEELKAKKPVVTSMSTYAASGGYYMSCNSDLIYAEPTTLTGSIGVFGMIPNANKLLTDKLGLSFEEVKTNKFGTMSFDKPLTPTECAIIQANVESTYALFLKRCSEGRKLPVEQIAKVAEGRVWTGETAATIGLVDKLGGLGEATKAAAKLAELDKYNTEMFPKEKDFFTKLIDNMNETEFISIKNMLITPENTVSQIIKNLKIDSPIQARMMNNITIE